MRGDLHAADGANPFSMARLAGSCPRSRLCILSLFRGSGTECVVGQAGGNNLVCAELWHFAVTQPHLGRVTGDIHMGSELLLQPLYLRLPPVQSGLLLGNVAGHKQTISTSLWHPTSF